MKKNDLTIRNFAYCLLTVVFMISLSSCGDDASDVTGCMEPDALNYDSTATIAGDCMYNEDRFYGTYQGTVMADVYQSIFVNPDSVSYVIEDDVDGLNDRVTLRVVIEEGGLAVPFEATVDGDNITVDAATLMLPCPATGESNIQTITGGGSLDADGVTMNASLNVKSTTMSGGTGCQDDTWVLFGVK